MNVLVNSSRMPFALDEIRKFGAAGHDVYAADTFHTAPGSHARAVVQHFEVPSPTYDTLAFVDRIVEIVDAQHIDVVVPGFEDVFFLARHRERLDPLTNLFCAPFETLARFHDKSTFQDLCRELGLAIPATTTVTSDDELREAVDRFPHYFARASFTRGGLDLLTNSGPLAGAVAVSDCHPTSQDPWIVQEFVRGTDLCTFSVAHEGRLSAHCTYEHPRTIEHSSGIVFQSIVEPGTLDAVATLTEATGYTGQISFDFLEGEDGTLYLIECNPRPTDGESLFAAADLVEPSSRPRTATPTSCPPAARRRSTWPSSSTWSTTGGTSPLMSTS